MSETTVKQLATLVGIPAEQLLSQMVGAGIDKSSPDDVVTDDEKQRLLAHIRSGQTKVSAEPAKVTLRRKSTSTIKAGAGAVNVEVRKKRTYVHRDLTAEAEKQRETEEAKLREEQEAQERARLEAEEAARITATVEDTVQPEVVESVAPAEEVSIAPAVVEPPPPPKEDDGRRHKKEPHVRRDRVDDDEKRRQGKPLSKRDDKRGKLVPTEDGRGPKMRGKRKPGKAAEELSSHKFEKPAAPMIREGRPRRGAPRRSRRRHPQGVVRQGAR